MNAISDYLDELAPQLVRTQRRRVLAEVRAHLLEAAAAGSRNGLDPDQAAVKAVERFGPPERVASQFNALRRRPGALVQRSAAAALAAATMATLGTATVWAIEPGPSHAHAQVRESLHSHRAGGRR